MPAQHRNKIIALVEDAKTAQELLKCAAARFEVLEAKTVARARDLAGAHADIAALVMDQTIGRDGWELLANLRATHPATMRVLLSAYGDLRPIVEGLESGIIQRVVQKPVRAGELMAALERDCLFDPPSEASTLRESAPSKAMPRSITSSW